MTDVMTATFVDAEKRPLSFEQAAPAMKAALSNQLGHDPSDEVLALALAKTALETGRWQSMWNDNWVTFPGGPGPFRPPKSSYCPSSKAGSKIRMAYW